MITDTETPDRTTVVLTQVGQRGGKVVWTVHMARPNGAVTCAHSDKTGLIRASAVPWEVAQAAERAWNQRWA